MLQLVRDRDNSPALITQGQVSHLLQVVRGKQEGRYLSVVHETAWETNGRASPPMITWNSGNMLGWGGLIEGTLVVGSVLQLSHPQGQLSHNAHVRGGMEPYSFVTYLHAR